MPLAAAAMSPWTRPGSRASGRVLGVAAHVARGTVGIQALEGVHAATGCCVCTQLHNRCCWTLPWGPRRSAVGLRPKTAAIPYGCTWNRVYVLGQARALAHATNTACSSPRPCNK